MRSPCSSGKDWALCSSFEATVLSVSSTQVATFSDIHTQWTKAACSNTQYISGASQTYLVALCCYGGSDAISSQERDLLVGQTQEGNTGVMNGRILMWRIRKIKWVQNNNILSVILSSIGAGRCSPPVYSYRVQARSTSTDKALLLSSQLPALRTRLRCSQTSHRPERKMRNCYEWLNSK